LSLNTIICFSLKKQSAHEERSCCYRRKGGKLKIPSMARRLRCWSRSTRMLFMRCSWAMRSFSSLW